MMAYTERYGPKEVPQFRGYKRIRTSLVGVYKRAGKSVN